MPCQHFQLRCSRAILLNFSKLKVRSLFLSLPAKQVKKLREINGSEAERKVTTNLARA